MENSIFNKRALDIYQIGGAEDFSTVIYLKRSKESKLNKSKIYRGASVENRFQDTFVKNVLEKINNGVLNLTDDIFLDDGYKKRNVFLFLMLHNRHEFIYDYVNKYGIDIHFLLRGGILRECVVRGDVDMFGFICKKISESGENNEGYHFLSLASPCNRISKFGSHAFSSIPAFVAYRFFGAKNAEIRRTYFLLLVYILYYGTGITVSRKILDIRQVLEKCFNVKKNQSSSWWLLGLYLYLFGEYNRKLPRDSSGKLQTSIFLMEVFDKMHEDPKRIFMDDYFIDTKSLRQAIRNHLEARYRFRLDEVQIIDNTGEEGEISVNDYKDLY